MAKPGKWKIVERLKLKERKPRRGGMLVDVRSNRSFTTP
jgi:hypothetical protein